MHPLLVIQIQSAPRALTEYIDGTTILHFYGNSKDVRLTVVKGDGTKRDVIIEHFKSKL